MSYTLEPAARLNECLLNDNKEDRSKAREYLSNIQHGCCAICDFHEADSPNERSLGLDHNHATDKIRCLLCAKCNTILGMANDSTLILKRAIAYLDSDGIL